jgi:ribose transport system permease protein
MIEMTEQNSIDFAKNSRADDFKGFTGAVLTLLPLIFPQIGGISPGLVAAAAAMQSAMALFVVGGALAFAVSAFNLVWGVRARLPAFLYAVPFVTLLCGALFWGVPAAFGAGPPVNGVAGALRGLLPSVKASADARILWALVFSGALFGLWGAYPGLTRNALSRHAALMALIALFSVSSELSPYFLQTGSLLNMARQVSYTGIIALGMTIVITSGGIDLSVGSLTALLGVVMTAVLGRYATAWGYGIAAALALLTGVFLGVLSGLTTGFVTAKTRMEPFIFTLGAGAVYRSLASYLVMDMSIGNSGEFISSSAFLFQKLGAGDPLFGVPYPVWTFILMALFCAALLSWTRFGRHACAAGASERAALYAGIDVGRVRAIAYASTGAMTAISAFLLTAHRAFYPAPATGAGLEVDVIAAVAIGGTSMRGGRGSVFGTVIGAAILGLLWNISAMLGVPDRLQGAVKGLAVIAAVAIQCEKRRS